MGFFSRLTKRDAPVREPSAGGSERAASRGGGSWTSLSQLASAFRTLAGIKVNEESAMCLSAYYACIRAIAEDVAKLPLITYRRLARGKERATENPAYSLLSKSSMAARETVSHWALGWGNGYAEIGFDGGGRPAALFPIHPSRVTPKESGGELVYLVRNQDASQTAIPANRMLHIHGLGGDGRTGYSVLRFASESVGLGLASQGFGASFFGNGANGGTVIECVGKLSDTAFNRLRESWNERFVGVQNGNKPIILEEGMKTSRLAIPPEEAQFLETRQFTVEDICRWFRVPPHKVQHLLRASGWSTLDASNTDYVTDSLMPWLIRWEQELNRKLFFNSDEYFAEHLIAGLMRGDMKTRAEFYKGMFSIGVMSINDIRESENMNPVEDGDAYFVPSNITPLSIAVTGRVNSANAQ